MNPDVLQHILAATYSPVNPGVQLQVVAPGTILISKGVVFPHEGINGLVRAGILHLLLLWHEEEATTRGGEL